MASLASSSGPPEAASVQSSDAHRPPAAPIATGEAEGAPSTISSSSASASSPVASPVPAQQRRGSSKAEECEHSMGSRNSDNPPKYPSRQAQGDVNRTPSHANNASHSSRASSASPPSAHAGQGTSDGAASPGSACREESRGNTGDASGTAATAAPTAAEAATSAGEMKGESSGETTGGAAPTSSSATSEAAEAREGSNAEPIDIASLFLSPSQDLDSWASEDGELLLPAGSFVSADAISSHRGPITLGRVALFLFSLFQGDVRMGLLSAQGRLLAWRCLLFLAEQHDRQTAGAAPQQQPAAAAAAAAAAADPNMRRRRLQRESVATSKGRRSVRHAFLLDRSGAARTAAGAAATPATAAAGGSSSYSPGAADEWAEAEEEPPSAAAAAAAAAAACVSMRGDPPGEVAGEQVRGVPGLSGALQLQRQLQQQRQQQQGQPNLGFEPNFTRFVGGTIDRRWALQHKWLRIPAAEAARGGESSSSREELNREETCKGEEMNIEDEPLDIRFEEFGATTASNMWPRTEALPEKIFVGLPIQVATRVGWGRSENGEPGQMLWRDCEVVQLLQNNSFRARCFAAGDPKDFVCHISDFVPPRLPCPCPTECAWRLLPLEADISRDIYPGACLSVGLTAAAPPQEQQQQAVARAYFVDVVVQDVYFYLEQASRAKAAVAEARERDEATGVRTVIIGRSRQQSSTDPANPAAAAATAAGAAAGATGPVEGLRPNCVVRAMRVMVLRTGGAANEFALVAGRRIYRLPFDLYNDNGGILRDCGGRRRPPSTVPRLVWAIPRALVPPAPRQLPQRTAVSAAGAATATAAATAGETTAEAAAKRWQYRTQDSSTEWTVFPPFVVVYIPFDGSACHRRTHPLLLRYLQPELDLKALAQGSWRLCLPQYESPSVPPVLLPHPSDASTPEKRGGAEGGSSSKQAQETSGEGQNAAAPPQPLNTGAAAAGAAGGTEAGPRASVLGINHLASLLCSGADGAPSRELLAKALPFFRGLLPHLTAAQPSAAAAADWQLDVARAAVRAAERARELYVEEEETEAERLRRQGLSFAGPAVGNAPPAEVPPQVARNQQRPAEAAGGGGAQEGKAEAWELFSSPGSRYPTSRDISRFLLRTSGHSLGVTTGRGGRNVDATNVQPEAPGVPQGAPQGNPRRRPVDAALAGLVAGSSRRGSGSELGAAGDRRGRVDESSYISRGAAAAAAAAAVAAAGDCDLHGSRRLTPAAVSVNPNFVRISPQEEAAGIPRTRSLLSAPSRGQAVGASMGAGGRRPVGAQRAEEDEDLHAALRGAAGGAAAAAAAAAAVRQGSSGGRAGPVRRATRNVSYAALAGLEEAAEEASLYRPLKRMARGGEGGPAAAATAHGAVDAAFRELWDRAHSIPREGGGGDSVDAAASDPRQQQQHAHSHAQAQAQARASLQQWVALQRQAAAAEERLRSSSSHATAAGEEREGEDSLCTDELQEALKGFVQSIKAGASPPVVSVPPLARDRSFAASH
ncbi:hypothetical protein, conserved [Eimeria brunetti]|uniref:Uncharacterized protein n=1 Tax=Eimeria brunetti TaxID=51314 RepID=U6LR50_9EIME|nr:hypothetical protein, conserved [Eimeria brunetti]